MKKEYVVLLNFRFFSKVYREGQRVMLDADSLNAIEGRYGKGQALALKEVLWHVEPNDDLSLADAVISAIESDSADKIKEVFLKVAEEVESEERYTNKKEAIAFLELFLDGEQ